MRLALLPATIAAAFAMALASAPPAHAAIVWRSNFESGNLSAWDHVWEAYPGGITVVRSPHRRGLATRFVVRHGDYVYDTDRAKRRNRAELTYQPPDKVGTEAWYRWSMYFPVGFRPSIGKFNIFTQFHDRQSSRPSQPTISFELKTARRPWRLNVHTSGGKRCGSRGGGCSQYSHSLGRLTMGAWITFRVHVLWSPSAAQGFIQVRRNGVLVVRKHHTATMYSDTASRGLLFHQGFYRAESSATSVVYLDSVVHMTR